MIDLWDFSSCSESSLGFMSYRKSSRKRSVRGARSCVFEPHCIGLTLPLSGNPQRRRSTSACVQHPACLFGQLRCLTGWEERGKYPGTCRGLRNFWLQRGLLAAEVCDCGSESFSGLCVGLSSAWVCSIRKLKVVYPKLKQIFLSHVSLKDNTFVESGSLGIFPEFS